MKPSIKFFACLLSVLCWLPLAANPANEEFTVNNIRAMIHADGIWFHGDDGFTGGFEVPPGEGLHAIFSASFWLAGYDDNGNLYTAAQTYRQRGVDYHPGPLKPGSAEPADSNTWNRLWKIDRDIIDNHKANFNNANYTIPDAILDWPAHGPDGFADVLAPFVDLDRNGTYNPADGDYPFFNGDEAIYFIANDNADSNSETGGKSFGIELLGMVFGYSNSGIEAIDNTLFLNLLITNRSDNTYYDVSAGIFTDVDLGDTTSLKNYFGSDVNRNMYFTYVGEEHDSQYGSSPPASGTMLLNKPMDVAITYHNDFTAIGNPEFAEHYYNYLNGFDKNSSSLSGMDEYPKFQYSGDPCKGEGWTEFNDNNLSSDRRGLGAVKIDTFRPGQTIELDVAYFYARSEQGNIESVCKLQNAADDIHAFYEEHIKPDRVMAVNDDPNPASLFKIYPNPADNFITIEPAYGLSGNVTLFDFHGRRISSTEIGLENRMNVSGLAPGLYYIEGTFNNRTARKKVLIRN